MSTKSVKWLRLSDGCKKSTLSGAYIYIYMYMVMYVCAYMNNTIPQYSFVCVNVENVAINVDERWATRQVKYGYNMRPMEAFTNKSTAKT